MMQPERNGNRYRFGFNGMEKDDEIKGTGNSYTTLFRQYDARVGRWLSLDTKAAQMPWESPYASMGNNPILSTDVLGDKFEKKSDRRKAKKVKRRAKGLISFYKGKLNENDLDEDMKSEYKEMISELNNAIKEVDELWKSKTVYTFNKTGWNTGGSTTLSETGVVTMNYDNFETMTHELKHAYQFEKGEINFNKKFKRGKLADIHDEVDAYKRGFAFGDRGHFDKLSEITATNVRNMKHPSTGKQPYVNLSSQRKDYNTLKRVNRLDQIELINDGNREYYSKRVIRESGSTNYLLCKRKVD